MRGEPSGDFLCEELAEGGEGRCLEAATDDFSEVAEDFRPKLPEADKSTELAYIDVSEFACLLCQSCRAACPRSTDCSFTTAYSVQQVCNTSRCVWV
eukprot:m.27604 g.27604  ORF g.27604 m.27604 type:complete len:97 (-) comp13981_c0_seq1:1627-1917(-)